MLLFLTCFILRCFMFKIHPEISKDLSCLQQNNTLNSANKYVGIDCNALFIKPNTYQNSLAGSVAKRNDEEVQMIVVYLSCESLVTREDCYKFNIAFNKVASHLEKFISLKKQIQVDVNVGSLSDYLGNIYKGNKILARSDYVAYIPIYSPCYLNDVYYPKALAKQILLNRSFSGADVVIFVNYQNKFCFDTDTSCSEDDYDPESIFAHELFHGLGLKSFYSEYKASKLKSYAHISKGGILSNRPYTVKLKYFIFDMFIYKSHEKIPVYVNLEKIETLVNGKEFKSKKKLREEISLKMKSFIEEYRSLATNKGSLFFKANSKFIGLETSLKPFNPSASVIHLCSDTYQDTQDEFMIYYKKSGGRMKEIVQKIGVWKEFPFGPDSLLILEQLGYELRTNDAFDPDIATIKKNSRKGCNIMNSTERLI